MKLEDEIKKVVADHLRKEILGEKAEFSLYFVGKPDEIDVAYMQELGKQFPNFSWKGFEPYFEVTYSYLTKEVRRSGVFGVDAGTGEIRTAPKYASG